MNAQPFLAYVICGLLLQSVVSCERKSAIGSIPNIPVASVLRRGNGGEPQTLDPSLADDAHAINVLRDLYEGLVVEAADGSLVAGVAERWEISSDGLQYTFHLREDAIWSDGTTVTADDFVAGFRRTLAPDSLSPYSFLLGSIRYYDAVTTGARPVTDIGVRAIDAHTLEIELANPANHFLGILALPIAFPLYSGQKSDVRQFGNPAHFVGNGPYLLEEIQPGFRIRLRRNARFRNATNVHMPYVDYFPIKNPDTELNMYRAGELDITNTVPPAKIEALRRSRPDELSISPSLALYYLAFDLSEPPMNVVALRQALSMAIDRRALVKIIGRGEQAAFGIVPTGVAGHEAARYIWQSADRLDREAQSRQLYAEAGYSVSKPLEITLMYDVGDIHETVALAVSGMWRDVLGMEVALDKREWKYFLASRENRTEWQIMRFSWFGDYNEATTFLNIFRSDSPQNLSGFRDSKYDELLDRAKRTIDVRTKTQLMNEAEEMLLAAYPVVPLYFYVSKHLVSPAVKNFEKNILDIHPSQYLIKSGGEDFIQSRPQ